MGCTASRPDSILCKDPEDNTFSSSSFDSTFSSHSSPTPATTQKPRVVSLPTPLVHHPPLKKGDTHHLVSLTSTTYGSLLLIEPPKDPCLASSPDNNTLKSQTLSLNSNDTTQSQSYVDLNKESSPSSLSPDSVINTWELMDGLDDSDFDSSVVPSKCKSSSWLCDGNKINSDFGDKPSSCRYTHFDGSVKKLQSHDDFGVVKLSDMLIKEPCSVTKPLWKHLSEEALLAKMDPNVVYSYRRALSSKNIVNNQCRSPSPSPSPGTVLKPVEVDDKGNSLLEEEYELVGAEDKVVLYFTTLRGIRKTFEDCCSVRNILKGFRVVIDERDISMDSSYKNELQCVLNGKALSLPHVFIRGKHVGGAEEIKQLNEAGELAKLLEDFPAKDPGIVCDSCGDVRFVPCPSCDGSRKVFDEDEGQLRRCLDCNENGLIRCPGCCL